ncbi:MAG: helix-turn-helix transcriptional regulator [Burkholderiales bacterium]|nr:helix-turn-helix transcriptional regulator [Anaerolineae bacterium]
MITLDVTPDDLVKLRFAYRPLLEIPLSYRVLVNPSFQSPYHRWIDEAYRALYANELPYLNALVPDHGYIPDFLTPTPSAKRVDIEADFAELLSTPDELIRKGISTLIEADGETEMRRFFLTYPREAVACLVEEMRGYWQRTLKTYWSRMISTLESDMLYRARRLALEGPAALLNDLHSSVTYHGDQIHIQPVCQHRSSDVELTLSGNGIQLVPLIFRGCGRMFQVDTDWPSMLAFGVHGTGLWHHKPPSQSLEMAMGAGRARVLQTLTTPATTGEVAHKAQISAATASQHLSRLAKAGLVEAHRNGKRVYYHLSQRGVELIELFERLY